MVSITAVECWGKGVGAPGVYKQEEGRTLNMSTSGFKFKFSLTDPTRKNDELCSGLNFY